MRPTESVRLPQVGSLTWDDCRLLVASIADYAIFMLDPQGRVTTWNLGAQTIKGYTAEEIVGQHFSKFFPPEDLAVGKPERELKLASEQGRVEDEGWRIRKDGSRFWANVVTTALRDETGTLRGFGKLMRDLTVRREAEEAVRQAEQRFHDLVDAVTDYAIFMLDPTGHVSTWNTGARRVKGYGDDEIVGQHFSVFYTPEDQATGKPSAILETVRNEGRFEGEGWRIRKDGSRFWANVVLTALRDEHGKLLGFAKVTRDLTERRANEAVERQLIREQAARQAAEAGELRLRESEQRYRSLSKRLEIVFESVSDGITVQDRAGKMVFANRAAARLCGFDDVEGMLGASSDDIGARFEILDEEGQPFVQKLPSRRVLEGEPFASATVHVRERATGRDWWSLVRSSAVAGDDGLPELSVNIWHDVTEQRRREYLTKQLGSATAALSVSLNIDEMFATLAKALVPGLADWCSIHLASEDALRAVAVAHSDPEKVADAIEFQKRFPPNPNQPRGIWNVIRTGQLEVHNDITSEMLAAASRSAEHREILTRVGMKAVLFAPIRDRDGICGVISLISAESGRRFDGLAVELVEELGRRAGIAIENAQLYRAAQEAAATAEHASRAKDEFLATVSHELRTPLNAIVGWASLLRGRDLDPAISKPIEVIHRNAEAQRKIIDDILDVSRVITGKFRLEPRPADLVSIAREAIEAIRPAAVAKKISIELASFCELALLVADPERLQQAVWNLFSNAVKFTDPGGKIRLEVRQEGSSFLLAVSDTGRGIEPSFLPHVFERFQQADSSITRRVGGLGLGLALVRHIVELHGGTVRAASDGPGKGATFTLTLPVRAIAPPAWDEGGTEVDASRRRAPIANLDGIRVLVVDDEPDARELIRTVLAEHGAQVELASSAEQGFDAFKRVRPDVLVSDISMPDEDGFSLLRRVRALPLPEGGAVPALALTAFARKEDQQRALEAGFSTHLGKPVDPDALAFTIGHLATPKKPA